MALHLHPLGPFSRSAESDAPGDRYAEGFKAAKLAAIAVADAEAQAWVAWQRYALGHQRANEALEHEMRINVARTIAGALAALKPEDAP